jgi:hypothetical protein
MDVSGFISTGHLLLSKAYLCMLAKIARGLGVTGVQVTTNHTPIPLPFAVLGIALEDMDMALPDVFNRRGGLEECIDR